MSIQGWMYLLVGITFSVYIGIALWSHVGSTSGFYVARGGIPLANGMATAGDWMSAALFIFMAGLIALEILIISARFDLPEGIILVYLHGFANFPILPKERHEIVRFLKKVETNFVAACHADCQELLSVRKDR